MKAKRAYLTAKEKAAMSARQGGVCFVWGCTNPIAIWEHFTPVAMGNAEKPDCGLCKEHADEKTKRDVKAIAKVKRIRKKLAGETKAKRPIRSRGFDKTKTKRFSGEVVKRG